jgi:hypothetical protein
MPKGKRTNILVAGIGKDNHRQVLQSSDRASPSNDADVTPIRMRIGGEVVDNQDYQISNGHQGHDTGVFQRVESPQKAQRYDDEHEGSHPKLTVHEERDVVCSTVESPHNSWHQLPNDYQIGDSNTKALDSNGSVEDYRRIRICNL